MFNSACIDEYGRPLVPLDEDKINGAKPVRIQDQIVTDENGRRRFHGAFTGGFSAGYWNTVGSQEGWKPQSFKSSRAEKAQPLGQKPLDFMDDEDLEEFGSAPLSLQEREEDPTLITQDEINLKRVLNLDKSKIMAAAEPELKAKKAEKEKRKLTEFNKRKLYVLEKYGCDTTNPKNVWHGVAEEEMIAAFEPACSETVADETPVYENIPTAPESQTDNFGLGDYTPINTSSDDAATPSISESSKNEKIMPKPLEVEVGNKQKKLSIRGQAFGVGALEEDDEDIYEKEDMSKYDFTLESRKKKQRFIKMLVQDGDAFEDKPLTNTKLKIERDSIKDLNEELNQTELTTNEVSNKIKEKRVFLKPRPWSEKKSRFGPPVDDGEQQTKQDANKNTKQLTEINADYIEKRKQDLLASITAKSNSFVTAGVINPIEDDVEIQKQEEKDTKKIDFPTNTSSFKPFPLNEAKQKRYEKFLESNACSEKDIEEFLLTIQPPEMSKWERETELKEFIQSRKLYRPLDGLMANRFVPSINNDDIQTKAITTPDELKSEKQKRKIVVERTTVPWKPCAQLCKRYNIAEPLSTRSSKESKNEQKKTSQISIFDYIEGSVHNKADFVTPTIIPRRFQAKTEEVRNQSNSIETEVKVQPKESKVMVPEVATARKSRWNIQEKEERKQEQVQNEKREIMVEPVKETQEKATKQIETNHQNDGKQRLSFIPKSERNVDTRAQTTSSILFQAIFNDNDQGDEEKQQEQQQEITEVTKITQSVFYSRGSCATTAASANLLRNTSPPRGIFAALFNENYERVKEKPNSQEDPEGSLKQKPRSCEKANEVNSDCYGPALPTNFYTSNTEKNQDHQVNDRHHEVAGQRIKYKGLKIVEKWVEKTDQNGSGNDTESSGSSNCKSSRKRKHKSKNSKKAKKTKKSTKKSKEKDKKLKHKSSKYC